MSWLRGYFSRFERDFNLGLIVIFSMVLIFSGKAVSPVVSGLITSSLYKPFDLLKSHLLVLKGASLENDSLRQQLARAAVELSVCQETKRADYVWRSAQDRLSRQGELVPLSRYRLSPGRVTSVSHDGHSLPVRATIARTRGDSLYRDQPVVDQSGLVGRIESVTNAYATVQLLTDPSSRVAARVSSSREMGIVKYLPASGLVLENFLAQGTIKVGDTVLSSGLGGVYPAGLVIGTVVHVSLPKGNPFYNVEVEPAANFRSLEALFSLTPVAP
ncbi:MAG TPA: rod shape-determining protein MreC [Candidatus Deferrimicrobium sp.]|nr:rod shape-determining protein MreC [Candidatus Deferrimicrobium sp.]